MPQDNANGLPEKLLNQVLSKSIYMSNTMKNKTFPTHENVDVIRIETSISFCGK